MTKKCTTKGTSANTKIKHYEGNGEEHNSVYGNMIALRGHGVKQLEKEKKNVLRKILGSK